jgi:hypothetical protein
MDASPIPMTVQRGGYWDGQYPQPGDTILVPPEHVLALEVAGFAVVTLPPISEPPRAATKGSKHGR